MSALTSAFILTIELCCVAAIALRISSWACDPDADVGERAVVSGVVGVAVIIGVLQVAGAVDMLRRGPVVLAHVALAAAVLALVPSRRVTTRWTPTFLGRLVAAPGVFFGAIAVIIGVRGRSLEHDTLQYHLPNAAFWMQTHNLWSLPPTEPGYFTNGYPSNGELTGLWLMLPSHGVQVAFAMNVVFAVLAVVASVMIVKELGGRPWAGGVAALAIVLAPFVFETQANSLMTDLAAASGILAGIALVMRAVRSPGVARWPILAGVALGIGVGSKDTALLPAVGAIVLLVWLLPQPARLRSAAWVVGGLVALCGFWLVRNTVAVGNPLFPQGLTIGSHHLLTGATGPLTKYSNSMFDHVLHRRSAPLREWGRLARTLVGPALAFLVLAVGGAIVGLRRGRLGVFLMGGLAVASFAAYALTPYTGGGTQGVGFLMGSQLRYMLPALLIAGAAAAAAAPRITAAVAVITIGWDASKDLNAQGLRADLLVGHTTEAVAALLALVVVAAPFVASLPRVLARTRPWRPAAAAVVGVAMLTVIAGVEHRASTRAATSLDVALARIGQSSGAVMAVGVGNVSDLLGTNLDRRVLSPVGASNVNLSVADLARAVQQSQPSAVVLGNSAYNNIPASWTPPGYVRASSAGGTTVYVRTPSSPAAPAAPATPSSPPTTLPPATTLPAPTTSVPAPPTTPAVRP